jgi:hypothetical protein
MIEKILNNKNIEVRKCTIWVKQIWKKEF